MTPGDNVPEEPNIAEQKPDQERLRQQWHIFDTALSHTPDFTYIFDLEGRFTYANRALLSLCVLAATNGAEALDVLRADANISIAILDLTMPVMTGEQALPLIRAAYPEIPIILSSGFNEAEISRAGIAGVLQKPYTVSAVISKVTQAHQAAI